MTLVVGLCNPWSYYDSTPHNAGKRAVKHLAGGNRFCTVVDGKVKYKKCVIGDTVLVYSENVAMNDSGKVVRSAMGGESSSRRLVVIHDDATQAIGCVKSRYGVLNLRVLSARGHNGIKSVISAVGGEFTRIGIGVKYCDSVTDVICTPAPQDVLRRIDESIKITLTLDYVGQQVMLSGTCT